MGDYDLEILEQYPIQVDNVRKVRGAFLCETDRGLMLLKQAALSKPRMLVMNEIHKAMKKQEHLRCDELIPNREGEFLTATEDGTTYYLKAWYPGRECDVRKHGEILEAARLLAKIHRLMELPGAREGFRSSDLLDEYRRHNREMKKVWSFIRKKPIKGEFESRFLECFEDMYRVAAAVEERLGNSSYRRLQKEAKERGSFIHGEYNYHNILITPEGMTAVNFEHVGRDLQAADLAYFLRKVMEKHDWNINVAYRLVDEYDRLKPLEDDDIDMLVTLLSFPEKFWKIINQYYNAGKAWVPAKNIDKLKIVIEQNMRRRELIDKMCGM